MTDSSETTRPHRTTTVAGAGTTSLLICFTSRLSSSSASMKISSTSPGRVRDPPSSLPASLSRGRLKSSGHQSPMFPGGAAKRRGFENPEPSSPKVTCIGQVRVKTKKQGKKIRILSRRRKPRINTNSNGLNSGINKLQQDSGGGVAIQQSNQRWVHLPLTICEALSCCLFPCRPPSCLRRGKEEEKQGRGRDQVEEEKEEVFDDYSGGVRARATSFLAPRLVFGDQCHEEVFADVGTSFHGHREIGERISLRRHEEQEEEEEEEEIEVFGGGGRCGGRMSVCVPPKNALLLMRSRSDPVRVSALAAKFWEEVQPTAADADKCEEEEEEEEEEEGGDEVEQPEEKLGLIEICKGEEEEKAEPDVGMVAEQGQGHEENSDEGKLEVSGEMRQEAGEQENPELEAEGVNQEAVADPASFETQDALLIVEGEQDDAPVREREESNSPSLLSVHLSSEAEKEEETEESSTLNEEDENAVLEEMEARDTPSKVEAEQAAAAAVISSEEREEKQEQEQEERESSEVTPLLPDCLLLMRCEPKLSMEVSKETWVCTTDFIRWLPERPPPKPPTDGGAGDGPKPKGKKRVVSTAADSKYQPPRSSCSLPAAVAGRVSTAARMEQQRAVSAAVAYEPLVLTRCKSEPNRTAAAKLKPESCFWKNRRLEPHSRAAVGVGAAGVGF